MKIYLIGSLRLPEIRLYAAKLRKLGFDVFDDWHAAGEQADEIWMDYERQRGRTYQEALEGHTVNHAFEYDLRHIEDSDIGILIMPAGKSAHLELGFMIGRGKRGYIYMPDEPERWDMMVKFADGVFTHWQDLEEALKKDLEG